MRQRNCGKCEFGENRGVYGGLECHRYPEPRPVLPEHWCGEFKQSRERKELPIDKISEKTEPPRSEPRPTSRNRESIPSGARRQENLAPKITGGNVTKPSNDK